MGRLTNLPRDQRPRERLLHRGAERLDDAELLALLLGWGRPGQDVLGLADQLLTELGSLDRLADSDPKELARLPGVGPARAARLSAATELGRRVLEARSGPRPQVHTAADVHRLLRPRVVGRRQETFWVIALDARHRVDRIHRVAEGGLTSVQVHPREVFRPLIRSGAAAAVLAHNHPSGDPHPSADDIQLSRRLAEVSAVVGIPVLDHVVVTPFDFASLAEEGFLA